MKNILITGSSRGIGLAAAQRFAAEGGWRIFINSAHSREALTAAEKALAAFPDTEAHALPGDISDEKTVREMFRQIDETAGGLDVLVNNAGADYAGLLQDMSLAEWNSVLDTNLTSMFLTTREAIPLMLRRHAGSIVNISSVWGTAGGALEAAYSAAKGGVAAFTRAMARELAPSGIRVNALAFGAIDTQMNARLDAAEKAALADEIPLGRMGTPGEAAEMIFHTAVTFSYLTAQVVTMDGGWMM